MFQPQLELTWYDVTGKSEDWGQTGTEGDSGEGRSTGYESESLGPKGWYNTTKYREGEWRKRHILRREGTNVNLTEE